MPPGTVLAQRDAAEERRLELACRVLARVAWASNSEISQACRWLLAQAQAQLGVIPEARATAESLMAGASPSQQARLAAFLERLDTAPEAVYIKLQP